VYFVLNSVDTKKYNYVKRKLEQ